MGRRRADPLLRMSFDNPWKLAMAGPPAPADPTSTGMRTVLVVAAAGGIAALAAAQPALPDGVTELRAALPGLFAGDAVPSLTVPALAAPSLAVPRSADPSAAPSPVAPASSAAAPSFAFAPPAVPSPEASSLAGDPPSAPVAQSPAIAAPAAPELAASPTEVDAPPELADPADAARAERERVDADRADAERADAERAEVERAEVERAEVERAEVERAEVERAEVERAEVERAESERAEQERAAAEAAATGGTQMLAGRVSSGFGQRGGRMHWGLDIAAPIGTPIHVPLAGRVVDAGPASGFGLWVRVEHEDGTVTTYGHVNRALVSRGDRVAAGDVIAEVGNRGRSTGPHLHIEVRRPDGTRVNPRPWLDERGIRYTESG